MYVSTFAVLPKNALYVVFLSDGKLGMCKLAGYTEPVLIVLSKNQLDKFLSHIVLTAQQRTRERRNSLRARIQDVVTLSRLYKR